MASVTNRVAKAVKVFTKVADELEAALEQGSREVVRIDNQITALQVDRNEVRTAMTRAAAIKAKIFDIVGDDK
jgi:prefoldin subunit 5